MDIEKLIERLNGLYTAFRADGEQKCSPEINTVAFGLMDAATALSTLQTENEGLKEKLYDGEGVNLVDYWMQQAKIEENGHRNCQAENEKLRAEAGAGETSSCYDVVFLCQQRQGDAA